MADIRTVIKDYLDYLDVEKNRSLNLSLHGHSGLATGDNLHGLVSRRAVVWLVDNGHAIEI